MKFSTYGYMGEACLMCDDCGASGNSCDERFNECLAKEFEDPRYGRVHHLTVSTYMLQHSSKLTREGWLHERDLLREFLVGGKSPRQIREERRELVDNGHRSFQIKSRTGLPVIPNESWAKTVLDIRLEDPVVYCEDVIAWASAVLADSEAIEI